MSLYFYRPAPITEGIATFEFSEGWPGTIADINYGLTFSFSSPTATGTENFESGW
jgi:hypothetical protein